MLKTKYIFFDFTGTLVKMRPAKLLADKLLLKKLTGKYRLGIITGAKRTETINILKKLDILKIFQVVITASDNVVRKPDPRLFPSLPIYGYIGDAKKDSVFAKNAGITFFRINKKYNINQIIKNLL